MGEGTGRLPCNSPRRRQASGGFGILGSRPGGHVELSLPPRAALWGMWGNDACDGKRP